MKKNKLSLNKIEISSLDASRLSDGGKNVLGGADSLQNLCIISVGRKTVCICESVKICESGSDACIHYKTDNCLPSAYLTNCDCVISEVF